MADNVPVRPATGPNINAATDVLADGSHSPKVSLLDGSGDETPISPATRGQQDNILAALEALSSAKSIVDVTPHNTTNFVDGACRALWVGTGGDVSIQINGQTRVTKNVPDGYLLMVEATRVNATATTASDIQAWY